MSQDEAVRRCQTHYQNLFEKSLVRFGNESEALDECLHGFLDGKPSIKGLQARGRSTALAACPFWWSSGAIGESWTAALALGRVLHHEDAIAFELVEHLLQVAPETLRWAIRYSRLFTRADSALWQLIRSRSQGEEWQIFIGVCDRLLEQLQPFDELIERAQQQLASLSLLETLSYLSVLAYEQLTPDAEQSTAESRGRGWQVFNRILLRKLQTCGDDDFKLNEVRLGASLQRHLSPLLFPSPAITRECVENLEAFAVLIVAMQERMDYEDSIDWFCFDEECRYQLKLGESVIYNETDCGTREWRRTERKSQALWHYWMSRGVGEFVELGLGETLIGSAENHELNRLAYIKALRSALQLCEIYGLDDELELTGGVRVKLFQVLLASELMSVFFQREYVQAFQQHHAECGVVAQALSRLAFDGLANGLQNRFPMTWAEDEEKARKIRGWTVCSEYPQGSLVAARAILTFWTSDLKALAATLKTQPGQPVPELHERPFYKIGRYNFQFPWVGAEQNNFTAAVNNLRRIGARRASLGEETRRIERRLAELFRERGFAVVVGYEPRRTLEDDPGEVDLICCRDGLVLILEVKSGYIRSTRHEVWLHRTNTLRKAARQLQRKRSAVIAALEHDHALAERLGRKAEKVGQPVYAWIVDTSIELDQQVVDGFLTVSLETLQVVLRDERQLLCPVDQLSAKGEAVPDASLFPDGFSATRLVEVVESGEVWAELERFFPEAS
ncbi:nuclease-related domain-containing protein [Geopseudomonas aromaticivorans]